MSQHDVDAAATVISFMYGTMVAHVRISVLASGLSSEKTRCLGCARQELANADQGQAGNVDDSCVMQYHFSCSVRPILMQHQRLATKP